MNRPWVMAMRWHELLFAHWPVPAAALREHVPQDLEIDTFDGKAWLGVVPFRMSCVRLRYTPGLPRLSVFPELNLRTYVRHGDRPGVWFFSLDAAGRWAVRIARAVWGLPYLHARMRCRRGADGWVRYDSARVDRRAPPAALKASYRPTNEPFRSEPGSLEHFLTERYCLYALGRRGRLRRGDIRHAPWPLQRAEWEAEICDMARIVGVEIPEEPPHLMYAEALTVRAWLPVRL